MVCAAVAALAWLFLADTKYTGRSASADLAEDSSGARGAAGGCDRRCRSVESRRARALADRMLSITNRYRKENKMEALAPNENLGRVADEQAAYMCVKGVLTHDSPGGGLREKMEKNNFRAVNIGENIAKQENADYREVARLWEKSGEHRKNILGDFVYSNVSTCLDRAGNRYWVQVFGKNMPNREIPDIEEIQKLKEYLERGFSGVENGKYIIMAKPGAGDGGGGGKQRTFGGFQPMDKEEQTRIARKLEGLFRPARPSRTRRSGEGPGHNIIDPNEDACESAQDCVPGKTVRPQVFNTDAGYSQAETIPYFRSSSAEKVPRFVFNTRTGHDPERSSSEAPTLSESQRPGRCSSTDGPASLSISPLIIIRTTTNTIYRTVTRTPETPTAPSTSGPGTSTAASSDLGSTTSAGRSETSPGASSTALHAGTASSLEEAGTTTVNVAEDILSGRYPKTYDGRRSDRPAEPPFDAEDAAAYRGPGSRDGARDLEPSKLFAKYFEDLKRLILTAIKKDSSALQDCACQAPSTGPDCCSGPKSTKSAWPASGSGSEGRPSGSSGSAVFAKLSTLLARTSRQADTIGSASALPETVSFVMGSESRSCSSADRRSGTTVSKDEVVRVIRDLLGENEFKIRILQDEEGADSRIEIARPLLN